MGIQRWIERWRQHRHDKLRLWVMMLVGIAIPVFVCWGLPNSLANQRDRREANDATATAVAADAFRAAHTDWVAQCNVPIASAAAGQKPAGIRVLALQSERVSDFQPAIPQHWQPDPSLRDVTIIACMGREIARNIHVCEDGRIPDLTQLQLAGSAPGTAGQPNDQARVTRYYTEIALYDAQSGMLLAHDTFPGPDPTICTDPRDGDLSGERASPEQFRGWLTELLTR